MTDRFHSEKLENAYDYFLHMMENDLFEEREDIERLEQVLKSWEVPFHSMEMDIGFMLEWEDALGHVTCTSEGLKARLKDHTPKVLLKGYQYLPKFLDSIAKKAK